MLPMPENQSAPQYPRAEFIDASVWHGSLDRAQEILVAHPEVASSDIHTAALHFQREGPRPKQYAEIAAYLRTKQGGS
jgi:hypothetical protein